MCWDVSIIWGSDICSLFDPTPHFRYSAPGGDNCKAPTYSCMASVKEGNKVMNTANHMLLRVLYWFVIVNVATYISSKQRHTQETVQSYRGTHTYTKPTNNI
jgi:hypothetical protein